MNTEYVTKTALKKKGWTDKGINLFLKTHDKEAKNPVYRSASPMKLYSTKKVEKIEQGKDFQEFQSKNVLKKEGSKNAVETKRQNVLKEIAAWKIQLEHRGMESIKRSAIYSYNQFKREKAEEFDNFDFIPANSKSDPLFLNRIIVNYLRHVLSNYDDKLEELFGRVGKSEAYRLVNTKIYSKIAEIYPELKDECDNQLMRKLDETNNQV